ncbi:MAG: heme A synthase [Betaproteobacteria bacterium RIFCSPLOWO2_12_FULL_62_13]|nr:MAG: heme A synthase [Betaproteobacteria bacterium RIFCSPLOWO2_12_FULL_62_13]
MTPMTYGREAPDPVRAQVAKWLLACCALVFALVVLGGVTRLTHSGLSIVEWQPLVGTVPPLTEADWTELFQKYQQTPEYQKVNAGMNLEEFKDIFWLEYFHRLLGRLIGIAFFVPLVYFLVRRKIDAALGLKLAGIFALGALQGVMGWYMVASGLVDDPRVSQYRLTAHLVLAFVIYGAMLWTALDLMSPQPLARDNHALPRLRRWTWGVTLLVSLLVISGGFVAGIRAGSAYNTFPLMNGQLVPPELLMLDPWYENFFNNMATVQFNHRLIAWLLVLFVPWTWLRAQAIELPRPIRALFHLLLVVLAIQVALGIGTLLLAVPVALATAHQGGALVVFTVAVALNHALRGAKVRQPASVQLHAA